MKVEQFIRYFGKKFAKDIFLHKTIKTTSFGSLKEVIYTIYENHESGPKLYYRQQYKLLDYESTDHTDMDFIIDFLQHKPSNISNET